MNKDFQNLLMEMNEHKLHDLYSTVTAWADSLRREIIRRAKNV